MDFHITNEENKQATEYQSVDSSLFHLREGRIFPNSLGGLFSGFFFWGGGGGGGGASGFVSNTGHSQIGLAKGFNSSFLMRGGMGSG